MVARLERIKRITNRLLTARSPVSAVLAIVVIAVVGACLVLRPSSAAPNNLPGDVNGDNNVTINDLSVLLSNFYTFASLAANRNADVNGDGNVNLTDLSVLLSNYGRTVPGTDPAGWNPPAVKRDLGFDPACSFSQWDEVLNNEVGTVETVNTPVTNGSCAAKFIQDGNTTGVWKRVELQNHRPANGAVSGEGGEAWYQFKIYPLSSGSSYYAINQFRTTDVSCYTGGTDIMPDKSLRFVVRGGSFTGNSGNGCSFPTEQEYTIGSIDFNKWYTLRYHYIWSSGSNGRAEVWLDDAKVVDFTGPTAAVGAGNIMFRTGIYSGPHTVIHSFVVDDAKIFAQ